MPPATGSRPTTMTDHEMQRVISGISSDRAREDPSACITALSPLVNAKEGRKFLLKQEGEKALMLIELFDWALKSREISINKGPILWTLRQLCACLETLPGSCVLPIDFKPSGQYHAAGGFAEVWRGSHGGREVAFKSIRASTQTDELARLKRKRRFCKEVILWISLVHPNILGLLGVCHWDDTPDARLTMVSEWMENGNITEYIKHHDAQRKLLLIDCAKGLEYLHRRNLVHGDLKGANILITSDNPVRACLADFGFMTIVYDEAGGPESTSALGGGTTPFMAPELLCPSKFGKSRCLVSKEADVYAFGMVILQVLTGMIPFQSLRDTEISYRVIGGDRPVMPTDPEGSGISGELWQLLSKCWHAQSEERPPIAEILQYLSQDTERGLVFPPSNIPRASDCESALQSGTNQYDYVFQTAFSQVQIEDTQPILMPMSPDSVEYPTRETRSPTSLFSAETQDVTPITTPGNSYIIIAEQKPPEPETPPRTVSSSSDSTAIVADSAGDRGGSGRAKEQGKVSTPLRPSPVLSQHEHDESQHDPTIHDARRVGLAETPAQGTRSSPSSGGKPRLQITTKSQIRSRNPDSPGTAFYTPGRSGEVADRRPFDSAMPIQVDYSGASSSSRVQAGPSRNVVDIRQQRVPQYQFPSQPRPAPQSDSKAADVAPRHGLRMSFLRPSRGARERGGDSMSSFSSSPFDEVLTRLSWANASAIPRREPQTQPFSRPKSKLGTDTTAATGREAPRFPRQGEVRMIPRWNGGKDRGEQGRVEGDDHSFMTTSTDYVSVSGEIEERPREQTLAQRPPSNSFIQRLLKKVGVRESSRQPNQAPGMHKNITSSISGSTVTIESIDTHAGPEQERIRTFSGLSPLVTSWQSGLRGMKRKGSARKTRANAR